MSTTIPFIFAAGAAALPAPKPAITVQIKTQESGKATIAWKDAAALFQNKEVTGTREGVSEGTRTIGFTDPAGNLRAFVVKKEVMQKYYGKEGAKFDNANEWIASPKQKIKIGGEGFEITAIASERGAFVIKVAEKDSTAQKAQVIYLTNGIYRGKSGDFAMNVSDQGIGTVEKDGNGGYSAVARLWNAYEGANTYAAGMGYLSGQAASVEITKEGFSAKVDTLAAVDCRFIGMQKESLKVRDKAYSSSNFFEQYDDGGAIVGTNDFTAGATHYVCPERTMELFERQDSSFSGFESKTRVLKYEYAVSSGEGKTAAVEKGRAYAVIGAGEERKGAALFIVGSMQVDGFAYALTGESVVALSPRVKGAIGNSGGQEIGCAFAKGQTSQSFALLSVDSTDAYARVGRIYFPDNGKGIEIRTGSDVMLGSAPAPLSAKEQRRNERKGIVQPETGPANISDLALGSNGLFVILPDNSKTCVLGWNSGFEQLSLANENDAPKPK